MHAWTQPRPREPSRSQRGAQADDSAACNPTSLHPEKWLSPFEKGLMVLANQQTKESALLASALAGGPAKSTGNQGVSADRLAGGPGTSQVAGLYPRA